MELELVEAKGFEQQLFAFHVAEVVPIKQLQLQPELLNYPIEVLQWQERVQEEEKVEGEAEQKGHHPGKGAQAFGYLLANSMAQQLKVKHVGAEVYVDEQDYQADADHAHSDVQHCEEYVGYYPCINISDIETTNKACYTYIV